MKSFLVSAIFYFLHIKSISNSYANEICHLLEFAKSLNLLPKENKVHL